MAKTTYSNLKIFAIEHSRKKFCDAFLCFTVAAVSIYHSDKFEFSLYLAGSSAGVAGGTLSLTGLFLAPVTGGSSLILTPVGLALSGVGVVARTSSVLRNGYSTKKIIADIQAKLDRDIELSNTLKDKMSEITRFCSNFTKTLRHSEKLNQAFQKFIEDNSGTDALTKMKVWLLLSEFCQDGNVGEGDESDSHCKLDPILAGRLTRAVLVSASHGIITAQLSLGLVGLGINIADIIVSSRNLKHNMKNESMLTVENMLTGLEKELASMTLLKNYLDIAGKQESPEIQNSRRMSGTEEGN
ncbi:hypothetical protein QYM36_012777 [Artemia franciscana]|uniref:Uncharacterized protein n=1 Tax=Artemia franciscana TaxID=6661 RepID=A0AA88HMT9_ARTSF|nr:hypothetical protein QYM36_012777 [Artemia franciscana]